MATTKKNGNGTTDLGVLGQNVHGAVEGNILVLRIDLSKTFGPSSSGKTEMVASTRGNRGVGDVFIGVNAFKYAPR